MSELSDFQLSVLRNTGDMRSTDTLVYPDKARGYYLLSHDHWKTTKRIPGDRFAEIQALCDKGLLTASVARQPIPGGAISVWYLHKTREAETLLLNLELAERVAA